MRDPDARRAVAGSALRTILRDLDAHASDAGPLSARRWEFELPPPYGPLRRLVIRLTPQPGDPTSFSLRGDLSGASQLLGVYLGMADAREALRNGDARDRLEAFLEWALEEVDALREAMQPFDLPLVAIDREGVPYAVLDHRDTGMERWGPGDLQCAWWRLLLHDAGAWHDAGVANSQAAGTRSGLHGRIRETLAAFDGLAVDEFSFRLWTPSPGGIGPPVRGTHSLQLRWGPPPPARGKGSGRDLRRHRPALARLREICGAVINASPDRDKALLWAAQAADRARAAERAPAPAPRGRSGVLGALTSALRSITGRRSR